MAIANLSNSVFVGEVSPCDMYGILRKNWNVGEHMSIALIESFGGHLFDVHKGSTKFMRNNVNFLPPFVCDMNLQQRFLKH